MHSFNCTTFFGKALRFVYQFWFGILCRVNIKAAVISRYSRNMGEAPDLLKPTTINEKLQVLKLGAYYKNEIVTICVDKYRVKEYVRECFPNGELKVAEAFAFYDSVSALLKGFSKGEIKHKQFVIKCNHGCGYNFICENRDLIDFNKLKKTLQKWMREDYWTRSAEPQYRFVKKRILVEEYLGECLKAYKFYCFNGKPKVVYVSCADNNGNKDVYLDFFDMEWNHLDIVLGNHPHSPFSIECPSTWNTMKEIAQKLSKRFPFVRVDLYEVGSDVYFSELTFLPTGGYMMLSPKGTARQWGDWLKL